MRATCSMRVISNRIILKYFCLVLCVLIFAIIFITQPISVQASALPDNNSSMESVMSKMRDRLHLTEEQEKKIRPIIEESFQARREILKSNPQDRSAIKNELQELQWKTDMRLGLILTKEQMEEYEKLREEQSERMQSSDMQGSRKGSRGGRSRGF